MKTYFSEVELKTEGPDDRGFFTCSLTSDDFIGVLTATSYNAERAQAYVLIELGNMQIENSRKSNQQIANIGPTELPELNGRAVLDRTPEKSKADFPPGTRVKLPPGQVGTVTGNTRGGVVVLVDGFNAPERFDPTHLTKIDDQGLVQFQEYERRPAELNSMTLDEWIATWGKK